MPRFAANLTVMWPELPFLDRFAAAAAAGFTGVEVLFPYDLPGPDIINRLAALNLTLVLINGPPPNYANRQRGFAAIPGGQALFRQDFRRAARVARAMGARHLHLMAGVAEGPDALAAMIENLTWAATEAPSQSLTIEPINRHDMPGYFLSGYDVALEILDQVQAPNLHLQFDAYHAHRITGDVPGTWARVGARVAHVQVAGHPGRHEPIGGEIDYPAFFARLNSDGYDGWVSGEYTPKGRTEDGLDWIKENAT
jgi:2-dehydrotetronate isomerase